MGDRIDVRILKLNKWYVPKTFVLEEQENYIAIGYFDAVQLKEVQIDPKQQHPFIGGYNKAVQWKEIEKEKLVDYSSQEQMLFANICETAQEDGTRFKMQTIDAFWGDMSSPYLFLSMIHISHIGNLEKVLRIVKKVFEKDYLSYISFDYCDIIVFAKKINIKEFFYKIKKVFRLSENEGKNMVFDTFSLVSFYPGYRQDQNEENGKLREKEQFSATVNLSVKDYSGFMKWYENLKMKYDQMGQYDMFGRHDISIVNNYADTDWLLTIMNELHREENQSLFWTFETYIKVPEDEAVDNKFYMVSLQNQLYEKVNEELQKKIILLKKAINSSDLRNKNSFLLPVCEARDCICSIVKNSFAEEFIYCIYESFRHFIVYMTDKIQQTNEKGNSKICEEKIAESYDKYFTALNTLVNSTMHSERQFIQATAFNAIFYSVPPKITAFYNAYIYRIKQILADEKNGYEYTFLIYPSFSPVVSVEKISLEDTPPCDRILSVRIDEKALYDVEVLSYQLVHELAHYIGDRVRCRSQRSQLIIGSLLELIIYLCDIQDKPTIRVLRSYADEYAESIDGYTESMGADGANFLTTLINDSNKKLKNRFDNYFSSEEKDAIGVCDKALYDLGIELLESQEAYMSFYPKQYSNQKYAIYVSQLCEMNKGENIKAYSCMIELLRNIYSECYADMQMILVLAVNPEDYLSMFFGKHSITVEELCNDPEDIMRVSIMLKVMIDCGIWEISMFQDNESREFVIWLLNTIEEIFKPIEGIRKNRRDKVLKRIKPLIEKYRVEVEKSIGFHRKLKKRESSDENMYRGKRDAQNIYVDPAYGLYEYLLNVMEDVLEEYQTTLKHEEIRKIRKIVKRIFDFEESIRVFNYIENEIDNYKNALFGNF